MHAHSWYFRLPDDSAAMGRLIGAISYSGTWTWIEGSLRPPAGLAGVAKAVGYDVGPHSQRLQVHSSRQADRAAFVVKRLLPAYVGFELAGFEERAFEEARKIAQGFVEMGYRGRLLVVAKSHGTNRDYNGARCNFQLSSWEGTWSSDESGNQPARLRLTFDSRYGGIEKDLEYILSECRSLRLEEYEPKRAVAA